ncbi:asialoglycoprotein receptor 2-like [Gigantopelta aegis]|uniref:asialoglycoprotein receptor 2-like n=1 Tax=Gigantopelta aegis TaxID=1735272 RepID=UPI001B88D5E3|nr:asialoglycoprotein receptor 2-like [Gigantopelta aegis]
MMKAGYFLTVCFILSVNKFLVEPASQCEGNALAVVDFEDKILYRHFLKKLHDVPTVAGCASVCARKVYCASFFYNIYSFICQLHYSVSDDPANSLPEAGSRYYVLYVDDITPRIFPNSLKTVCGWNFYSYSYYYDAQNGSEVCIRHSGDYTDTPDGARSLCTIDGGRLLQLETAAKNSFIQSIVSQYFNEHSVYIGGTRFNGVWVWNWDTDKTIQFYDWGVTKSQQPDGDGDCIRLSKSAKYLWSDGPCDSSHRFICEIVLED